MKGHHRNTAVHLKLKPWHLARRQENVSWTEEKLNCSANCVSVSVDWVCYCVTDEVQITNTKIMRFISTY